MSFLCGGNFGVEDSAERESLLRLVIDRLRLVGGVALHDTDVAVLGLIAPVGGLTVINPVVESEGVFTSLWLVLLRGSQADSLADLASFYAVVSETVLLELSVHLLSSVIDFVSLRGQGFPTVNLHDVACDLKSLLRAEENNGLRDFIRRRNALLNFAGLNCTPIIVLL